MNKIHKAEKYKTFLEFVVRTSLLSVSNFVAKQHKERFLNQASVNGVITYCGHRTRLDKLECIFIILIILHYSDLNN